VPDDAAKGFGRSVSLDAAGAEGDEPCATAALKHTHPSTTQRTAIILCRESRVRVGDGFGSSRNLLAVQVFLAPPPNPIALTAGAVRRRRALLTRRGGCQ
jgi:hypothetical protein